MGKGVGTVKADHGVGPFCAHCGTQNAPDARFCRSCGSPVGTPGTTPAPPTPRRLSPAAMAMGLLALVVLSAAAVVALTGGDDEDQATDRATPTTIEDDSEGDGSGDGDSVAADADTELDLVLDDEGLGDLRFGAPADTTIGALTDAIGEPDADTGENPDNYCPGGDLFRAVRWGPLVVLIKFGSISDSPSRVDPFFWGWSYSRYSGYTGELLEGIEDTLELTSPSGIGLASRGADIEARTTDWEFYDGDPVGFPPPTYFADDLYIVVDANGPQGRVNTLSAGGACGE